MDPYEDLVLTAIADSLSEIEGLQESPYVLNQATAPSAELIPGEVEYDETFGGRHHWNATVRVTTGTSLDKGAQIKLREFRSATGPRSIKAAVEADRTLGGLVDDVHIGSCGPVRQFRRPDNSVVLGCDFALEFNGVESNAD